MNQSEIDLQQAIIESEAGLPDEVEDLTIENRKTVIVPSSEMHGIKQAEAKNVEQDEDEQPEVVENDDGLFEESSNVDDQRNQARPSVTSSQNKDRVTTDENFNSFDN